MKMFFEFSQGAGGTVCKVISKHGDGAVYSKRLTAQGRYISLGDQQENRRNCYCWKSERI